MLRKTERLLRTGFDRTFARGKRIHTPLFQLIYEPSDAFHGSVVVGKKVAKKAVDRNRLRRQIYGVLYRASREADARLTVIIIVKAGALSVPRKTLALEAKALLSRVV